MASRRVKSIFRDHNTIDPKHVVDTQFRGRSKPSSGTTANVKQTCGGTRAQQGAQCCGSPRYRVGGFSVFVVDVCCHWIVFLRGMFEKIERQ